MSAVLWKAGDNLHEAMFCEGIRLVEERENRLATLDAALGRGIADADAAGTKPARVVAKRLSAKYEGMAASLKGGD